MASVPDLFQRLAGELVSFFEWIGDAVGDPLASAALIKDLGGNPAGAAAAPGLPADHLDAVKTYRDAADPTAEQGAQALADIAVLLDAVASIVETWLHSAGAGAQETGHALLELAASNYVRLRFPRLFIVLQLVALLEDITSTYGEGANNLVRVGSALKSVFAFLLQPGKSLEQVEHTTSRDRVALYTDFGVRLAATVVGVLDGIRGVELVPDILTGWDGPGLDADSPDTPAKADVVSERMTSFSFAWQTSGTPAAPAAAGKLLVSTAMVPADEGGTAVFLALGGNIDIEAPISDRWMFSAKARSDAGVAALIGSQFRLGGPDGGSFQASIGYASRPDASSQLSFSLPSAKGSRLQIGTLTFTLSLASSGAEMLVGLRDAAVVIDSSDNDGFIAELLGHTALRLPFSLVVGYSSSRGLVLEGHAPPAGVPAQPNAPLSGSGNVGPPVIAATIPIGRAFGPVTVHEVGIRLSRGPADAAAADMNQLSLEVDTSFSAQIGPVYLRLDQLGLLAFIDGSKPPAQRNLRFVDLHAGIKFPRGVAVEVDTALVAGGGSILHDPDQGIYFGTLDLAFRGGMVLKAIALVHTRNPDGTKGFSLVVLLTVELASPYPLPLGFFLLKGIGGMLALHHTFDETAARAALPTGQLRNVLFPADPVHHTTEVLHALELLFPGRRGSHLFGLLVQIGWASPSLVDFELGVLYEWGHQHRLILLGRVRSILPRTDLAILRLEMDAVGILDFDAGTFALDATLHDSRLCGRFVITGAMAMRMAWTGSGGFALAIGGLHPRFAPPAGFPSVARLQLALTNGDNPKLICQAYFGITSNTVQFGADCSLYAAAFGFSIEGDVGFDVLVQLLPFHFLADYHASVQLKRGSTNLFKVTVEGELEGPLPLRLSGKATFEILWCDFSVPYNATLVDGGVPNDAPRIDVMHALLGALSDPAAWQAQLPPSASQLVTLRDAKARGVLVHPLGTLTVRQTVVPLGLVRDIDRIGTATPSGERRFAITRAAIGTAPQARADVQELFAPAQFFDMTDEDKLAAPSFEAMTAGVRFGDGGYTLDAAAAAASQFTYTDIVIGPDGAPVLQPQPHTHDGAAVLALTRTSAAAGARARRTLAQRFEAPVSAAAPSTNRAGWAAVQPGGARPADATLTWIEARSQATPGAGFVLVPRAELAL